MIPQPSQQQEQKIKRLNGLFVLTSALMLGLLISAIVTGNVTRALISLTTFTVVYPLAIITSLTIGLIKMIEKKRQNNPLTDMAENMAEMMNTGSENEEEISEEIFSQGDKEE